MIMASTKQWDPAQAPPASSIVPSNNPQPMPIPLQQPNYQHLQVEYPNSVSSLRYIPSPPLIENQVSHIGQRRRSQIGQRPQVSNLPMLLNGAKQEAGTSYPHPQRAAFKIEDRQLVQSANDMDSTAQPAPYAMTQNVPMFASVTSPRPVPASSGLNHASRQDLPASYQSGRRFSQSQGSFHGHDYYPEQHSSRHSSQHNSYNTYDNSDTELFHARRSRRESNGRRESYAAPPLPSIEHSRSVPLGSYLHHRQRRTSTVDSPDHVETRTQRHAKSSNQPLDFDYSEEEEARTAWRSRSPYSTRSRHRSQTSRPRQRKQMLAMPHESHNRTRHRRHRALSSNASTRSVKPRLRTASTSSNPVDDSNFSPSTSPRLKINFQPTSSDESDYFSSEDDRRHLTPSMLRARPKSRARSISRRPLPPGADTYPLNKRNIVNGTMGGAVGNAMLPGTGNMFDPAIGGGLGRPGADDLGRSLEGTSLHSVKKGRKKGNRHLTDFEAGKKAGEEAARKNADFRKRILFGGSGGGGA